MTHAGRKVWVVAFGVAMVVAGGVVGGASVSWADAGPCGTAGVYALQGDTAPCTYKTAGADTFVVRPRVKTVTVTAVGGQGGTYPPPNTFVWQGGYNGVGGAGAEVTGTLSSPPSPLYVEVGADGGDSIGHGSGTGGEPDGADGGLASGSFEFLGDQGSGGGGSSDVSSTPASAGGLTGGPGDPRLSRRQSGFRPGVSPIWFASWWRERPEIRRPGTRLWWLVARNLARMLLPGQEPRARRL
jgi:hypothetical protein